MSGTRSGKRFNDAHQLRGNTVHRRNSTQGMHINEKKMNKKFIKVNQQCDRMVISTGFNDKEDTSSKHYGSVHVRSIKKMEKWKSPSPILMKLGTIDVLYGSMK